MRRFEWRFVGDWIHCVPMMRWCDGGSQSKMLIAKWNGLRCFVNERSSGSMLVRAWLLRSARSLIQKLIA